MSLLTDTSVPVPYDFLASFQKASESTGLDFALTFDMYFQIGYIFKGPDYLMLGSRDQTRPDAWFVAWVEIHPVPANPLQAVATFMKLVPYHLPYVGWARYLKNRRQVVYYSTDRLLKLTARLR